MSEVLTSFPTGSLGASHVDMEDMQTTSLTGSGELTILYINALILIRFS